MSNSSNQGPQGRHRLFAALVLLMAVVFSAPSYAQDTTTVWSINSSNGRLSTADFDLEKTTPVNDDANELTSPRALAFRDDGGGNGQILVADTLGGSVLIYAVDDTGTADTADVVLNETSLRPDGIDIDSLGNLFGTSGSPGGSLPAQVWALERASQCSEPGGDCLSGGYTLPLRFLDRQILVDDNEVRLLSESLIAREAHGDIGAGGLRDIEAGDLLVLAQDPALLLLYRRKSTDPQDPNAPKIPGIVDVLAGTADEMDPDVLISTAGFPPGVEPTGIAFAPDGNLLISTSGGNILRYEPDGTRVVDDAGVGDDFANDLGNGKFKLVVASDEEEFKVYVANRNGGELLRFIIEADGTGMLDSTITEGVQFPEDLVANTGNTIPVAKNINTPTTLNPSSVLQSIVDQVLAAGAISATAFAIPDIPDTDQGCDPDPPDPLPDDYVPDTPGRFLSDLDGSLPPICIPSFIRALGDNSTPAVPTFVLVRVETTSSLSVEGIVQHLGDGEQVLGVEYDCDDDDSSLVPQLAWAADVAGGDRLGPEGDTFVNISNDCASSRGSRFEFSFLLLDHSDTRDPVEIAGFQFVHLDTVMLDDASTCVASNIFKKLSRALTSAERNFSKGRLSRARNDMLKFEAIADGSPNAFSSCTVNDANMSGNLRSRAQAIAYQLFREIQP